MKNLFLLLIVSILSINTNAQVDFNTQVNAYSYTFDGEETTNDPVTLILNYGNNDDAILIGNHATYISYIEYIETVDIDSSMYAIYNGRTSNTEELISLLFSVDREEIIVIGHESLRKFTYFNPIVNSDQLNLQDH